MQRREKELDSSTDGLSKVVAKLKETQARVDEARAHQKELGRRARALDEALAAQKEAAARSQNHLEERLRLAYKGEDLKGVLLLLKAPTGGNDGKVGGSVALQTTHLLAESSRSIQYYEDDRRNLKSTLRQLEQSKAEYGQVGDEGQPLVEELRGHESELRASVEGLGLQREQIKERLVQLEAKEKAGLFKRPPATGGTEKATGNAGKDRAPGRDEGRPWDQKKYQKGTGEERKEARERELEIARNDIVARPVEPIPYEGYVRLYKESAKRYGFGGDWYVLAAVGKIESDHGENMGPSSAGALGPMQFLPSTWSSYGVDGDGDGEANIMDPKDAIPGAAAYLKAGGAPGDWYAALFAYNRATWYVEEVLAIAESYRRIYGDDSVGPYLKPATSPTAETSPRYKPAPPRKDAVVGGGGEGPQNEAPPVEETSPPPGEQRPATDSDTTEVTVPVPDAPAAGARTTVEQYQY